MANDSNHFCPGCGAAQKPVPRYPVYFCQDCIALASDSGGRFYKFGNVSMSGGLTYRYADEDDSTTILQAVCLIKNHPVLITEARFGGVVTQPISDPQISRLLQDKNSKTTDLRHGNLPFT